jgi:glycosyltransferase involved in cell wall biosynthesis
MEPRVSVIMAVYNGERYLREAVDSILAQSLPDLELIVVNDGSSDKTPEILASYMDPRVRVSHNERNVGPAAARNTAISLARAPYIAIQDADDVALPYRLHKQVCFLETNASISLVGSHAVTIDEHGREQGALTSPPAEDKEIKWELLFRNPFIHSSVMIRRSILDGMRHYTDDPVLCRAFVEDYELLSRINRVARSANVPEPLEKYRLNPRGVSARTYSEQQRQVGEISKRNICWLLGWTEMDICAWCALRQFSLDWAPLTADEVSCALALNEAIHETFASRYLTRDLAGQHRRRYYLPWARRAFAQFRRNPHLDYRCRGVMLGAAAKFLLNTWRPGLLSFSNYTIASVREQRGQV